MFVGGGAPRSLCIAAKSLLLQCSHERLGRSMYTTQTLTSALHCVVGTGGSSAIWCNLQEVIKSRRCGTGDVRRAQGRKQA